MIDTSKHLVIAGTGRAGTSFLVMWLGDSGVDIGDDLTWSTTADAGYERKYSIFIGPTKPDTLPKVVKDPWLFAYCDDVKVGTIGELVIPIRDLGDAAASRVAKHGKGFNGYFAMVAGGMIVEINQQDEERILAQGFHKLIHWATDAEIPYRTISFPRLVNDAEYCVDQFKTWLPDPEVALQAHKDLARKKEK